MDTLLKKEKKIPLTPIQYKEGTKKRQVFRDKLNKDLNEILNNLTYFKNFGQVSIGSNVNAYKRLIEDNLKWVKENIEVDPRDVEIKERGYKESKRSLRESIVRDLNEAGLARQLEEHKEIVTQYPFTDEKNKEDPDYPPENFKQELNSAYIRREQLEKQRKKDNPSALPFEEQSTTQIASQAFWIVFYICIALFYVAISLRIASFFSNDSIHLPTPYRILSFLYGFLFSPLLLPYYIYREVLGWWSGNDSLRPHFEGLLPINPYPTKSSVEEVTITERLFGYEQTDALKEFIKLKQKIDECKKRKTLLSDVLEKLKLQPPP